MSGNYTNDELVVENAIREYAHDLFADHVVGEYEDRIIEWKKYINRVLDAEKEALKNHEETLRKVLNEKQKQDQRNNYEKKFSSNVRNFKRYRARRKRGLGAVHGQTAENKVGKTD